MSGLLLAVALAFISFGAAIARADDFYKDKTFTIVVGFSPGGGYDAYARALARHIGEHIPGHPSVIVENLPGAGSLTSVRYLNLTAPEDGTVMTIFNPGLVTQSILEQDKVHLDFRNYAWIGVVTPDFRVCYGFGPDGVRSWSDLMHRKQFILGSTAKGAGNYINGATLRDVFHAPVKQILGFPGSADQRLAIERGELDGDCGSFSSIPPEWIKDGKAHTFVRFMEKRASDIPESAVYIGTFAKTNEQRQVLKVLDAADEIGRPFIMSNRVPTDRVAMIRKAFDETIQDKAFLADMANQQLPVNPVSGNEAERIVAKLMKIPTVVADQARRIYE
jgi:tripartite-type tricarboxylate transporter receptor subunit TctC